MPKLPGTDDTSATIPAGARSTGGDRPPAKQRRRLTAARSSGRRHAAWAIAIALGATGVVATATADRWVATDAPAPEYLPTAGLVSEPFTDGVAIALEQLGIDPKAIDVDPAVLAAMPELPENIATALADPERVITEFTRDTPFDMFALKWTGHRDVDAIVRSLRTDGTWSPWYPAPTATNTARAENNGTRMIYVEPSTKIQVLTRNIARLLQEDPAATPAGHGDHAAPAAAAPERPAAPAPADAPAPAPAPVPVEAPQAPAAQPDPARPAAPEASTPPAAPAPDAGADTAADAAPAAQGPTATDAPAAATHGAPNSPAGHSPAGHGSAVQPAPAAPAAPAAHTAPAGVSGQPMDYHDGVPAIGHDAATAATAAPAAAGILPGRGSARVDEGVSSVPAIDGTPAPVTGHFGDLPAAGTTIAEQIDSPTQAPAPADSPAPAGPALPELIDPNHITAVFASATSPTLAADQAHHDDIALTAGIADLKGRPAPFLARSAWAGDVAPSRCTTPTIDDQVSAISIGETGGSNNYQVADVPQLLRNIYTYDTQELGMCDVAFNAFVDKNGAVWEGRSGGLNKPLRSDATPGFNENTWSVGLLGNFTDQAPPENMLRGTGNLAGWRAYVAGFNPNGTDTHSAEIDNGRYTKDQQVVLPNIFAASDVTTQRETQLAASMGQIRQFAQVRYDEILNGDFDAETNAEVEAFRKKQQAEAKLKKDSGAAAAALLRSLTGAGAAEGTGDAGSSSSSSDETSSGSSGSSTLDKLLSKDSSGAVLKVTGSVLALAAAAAVARGLVPDDVRSIGNHPVLGGMTLKDLPVVITKIINLGGDTKYARNWNRINSTFGPVLGEIIGGEHSAPTGAKSTTPGSSATTTTPGGNAPAGTAPAVPAVPGATGTTVAETTGDDVMNWVPFTRGLIVDSPRTGTHGIWGAIGDAWASQGFAAGPLGMPLNEEHPTDTPHELRTDFEGGFITFDQATGLTHVHAGDLDYVIPVGGAPTSITDARPPAAPAKDVPAHRVDVPPTPRLGSS